MINPYKLSQFKKNKKLNSYGFLNPLETSQARINVKGAGQKMVSIREQAKEYKVSETLNIVDLDSVNTEMDLLTKDITNEDPEKCFSYDYIVVDEIEYRVPKTVIKQLKAQLEAKPESVSFKVTKSGKGLGTEYSVIMLD